MLNDSTNSKMEEKDNICRSCMVKNSKMRNLFDNTGGEKNLQLAQMLKDCASINVQNGDGLPESVCDECELKIILSYDFKKQCEKSDATMRELANLIDSDNLTDVKPILSTSKDDSDFSDGDDSIGERFEVDSPNESLAFPCKVCDKSFEKQKGLRMHERIHNSKLVMCYVCNNKVSKKELTKHLAEHKENGEFKHVCEKCNLSFGTASRLTKHKKEDKCKIIKKESTESLEESEDMDSVSIAKRAKLVADKKGKSFECVFCHKVLTTYLGFNIHMRRHTGINMHDCTICSKSFTKNGHLKRHLASLHGVDLIKTEKSDKTPEKKVVFQCEFCDRKFRYKKSYNHHMQTEHDMEDNHETNIPLLSELRTNPDPSDVDSLLKVELNEDGLDEVRLDETAIEGPFTEEAPMKESGRRLHTCHVCRAQFARSNYLTRHMILHRAMLVHKCANCDKAFASEEYLEKHNQEDHINKPYICTICNKTFSRGEHFIRHLNIHMTTEVNVSKCSVCLKEFTKTDLLARHIKMHLQEDKRHVCAECGKAFNRLDNLKTHQRIHTGQKDASKLHLCVYCGKEFNNSSNMIVHMRRHTGERPYKCAQCGKGFPRSHDLKCHERTHSGEKPYLCTLCGKSFNKSNKLLRHTRVHTGERPYVCNLCGRAFTQSNDLALHMRRHTGSRPYACGVCPARFIQSGQLKTHRRSMGHYMDIQPDLKGGHRVELVVPLKDPTPIKFKSHGYKKAAEDELDRRLDEEKVDDVDEAEIDADYVNEEPKVLNHTIGIMGNVQMPTQNTVDIHKTYSQTTNSFTTSDVNISELDVNPNDPSNKYDGGIKLLQAPVTTTFQNYTNSPTTSTFTITETYPNYQNYG